MRTLLATLSVICVLHAVLAAAQPAPAASGLQGIEIGTYLQEVRTFYATNDGLPANTVTSVAVNNALVYAATDQGVAVFESGSWQSVSGANERVTHLASVPNGVLAVRNSELLSIEGRAATRAGDISPELAPSITCLGAAGSTVWLGTRSGLFLRETSQGPFKPADDAIRESLGDRTEVRQVACAADGRVGVAYAGGLFLRDTAGAWSRLSPSAGARSWAPIDVRGVAFDTRGRLWFASPQGAGCLDGETWTLYDGADGLPFNDFTTMAPGEDGVVWFGTAIGAIRFDGTIWEYRQGPSWVPADTIHSVAVGASGDAWFATENGVGVIERKPMTLVQKAAYFSEELDRYNRRTPYGFVLEARLENPGDKTKVTNHDSDNDGLWTAMYGAAECFRYAATKDPEAKRRAMRAFEALRFLSEVTQGGQHPAPPGFPARSILPIDGRNPNEQDNAERDRQRQERDPEWKIIEPRWPVSADGKWYWKTDTSSDELDGHYFLYATCYDLVAETEEEKARVRETTLAITDHLLEHDYALVDHDGKPTRWAQYGPHVLNYDTSSGGRGLNSLSILSYLKVAYHMSGDEKYQRAYRDLIDHHAYAMNTLIPKTAMGPGNGNQSDDEMAFMGYYNLFKYEKDPELLQFYNRSLFTYWQLEARELCPLFNYIFAACIEDQDVRGMRRFAGEGFLEEALDTLKRYRMDRIEWPLKNSHRLDLVKFTGGFSRGGGRGHRVGGKVLPIDERNVNHWNHDPWRLDYGGDGRELTDGTAFLLPYYMGLYHGYIVEK